MKRTEFFHYRYILDPRVMSMFDSIADKAEREMIARNFFSDASYVLGRSNWTARARGGVMVAAFLAKSKEGGGFDIIADHEGDPTADKILWVVRRCSGLENYNKRESRMKARALANSSTVLISENHDYSIVKQVARKLVDMAEERYRHSHVKNQIWKSLKESFSIDAWVANNFQSSDVTVTQVEPLKFGVGGILR